MVTDVCRLRTIDFWQLRKPRIGYLDQQEIQSSQVDLATAGMIHYSLHPGMLIRFVKGEYIGENRNVPQVLNDVLPYINAVDAEHIEHILSMGCLSIIDFEEPSEKKTTIIEKGNQATFKMYQESLPPFFGFPPFFKYSDPDFKKSGLDFIQSGFLLSLIV
jgi:hypothetical protein